VKEKQTNFFKLVDHLVDSAFPRPFFVLFLFLVFTEKIFRQQILRSKLEEK
jgi:hypothetical protein